MLLTGIIDLLTPTLSIVPVVLEGFRRDTPIRELCHREGFHTGTYYTRFKDFVKTREESLTRDTIRDSTRSEVQDIKHENARLKQLVAELSLQVHLLKKRPYRVWNKEKVCPGDC